MRNGNCASLACDNLAFLPNVIRSRARMPLKTLGFMNVRQRNRHFSAHGAEFGASNAQDYEKLADEFLGGVAASGVLENVRSRGDMVRYDPATEAFGVMDSTGIIRTYFKPVPCVNVPASIRAIEKNAGRCHDLPDNLSYFRSECLRW